MTRAARRATTLLLAVLTAATMTVALWAGPALATEGEESEAQGTEEAGAGFGDGQWDGLLLAAVLGVVVGGVVFAMSRPGDIPRADDGHH